jgi:hypothetical protein
MAGPVVSDAVWTVRVGAAGRRDHHRDPDPLAHQQPRPRPEVVQGQQLGGPGVEPDGQPGGAVTALHPVDHDPAPRVAGPPVRV